MWVIVGLGNPGSRYSRTRHNVGFLVIDGIAEKYGLDLKPKVQYIIGKGSIEDDNIILLEPLTFMNRSGLAVRDVLRRSGIPTTNLIVVHDDIDMETGRLKIRKNGSSGGHKGIESIIQDIGTKEFIRVKLGVGREKGIPVEDYVLSKFRKDEALLIKDAIIRAVDAIATIVKDGIDKAMNRFN